MPGLPTSLGLPTSSGVPTNSALPTSPGLQSGRFNIHQRPPFPRERRAESTSGPHFRASAEQNPPAAPNSARAPSKNTHCDVTVPTTPTQRHRPPRFRRFDFSTFPPKIHLKREPPQPMPATRVASEKNRVCHYMSPSILQLLRAINVFVFTLDTLAPRSLGPFFRLLSPSISSPPVASGAPAGRITPEYARMPPRDPTAQYFDVSTFRFFDVSTQKLEAPQPTAATSVGTFPERLVSPYVTLR